MKAKTDLGKEILDIVKDTKEYLLFLKETGVAEVFTEEPSMRLRLTKGHENIPPLSPLPQGERKSIGSPIIPPPLMGGGKGEGEQRVLAPLPLVPSHEGRGNKERGFSDERESRGNSAKTLGLADLREKIGECKRCKLWNGRTHIVFGTGNPGARLLFVGEGPGEEEDRQGKPFVGRAGELLTKMIGAMGLVRDDVYIANVIKCRPPQNRNPEEDEITACRPFLEEQIEIIRPEVICALGTFAAHTLLETEVKISGLRGKVHVKDNYKIVPTFHPAYLLRNAGHKRLAWEDLQIIMTELGLKNHKEG